MSPSWFIALLSAFVAAIASPAIEIETGAQPASPAPFADVAFIGASVTAGFGSELEYELDGETLTTGFSLASILEAADTTEAGRYRSFDDPFFFGSPLQTGPRLLEQALAGKPTLIVGLDFLFWFAYGGTDHEDRPIESREQRFLKLERGLALLEPIECTLVLGDLADMSSAIGTMLMPSHVPDSETLAILNGKLYEWADERENVIVLPLAKTVARIQADQELELGDFVWSAGTRAKLLNEDRLHSTLDGAIALVQLIVARLDEAGLVGDVALELEPGALRARLRERALATARREAELRNAKRAALEKVPSGG